MSTEKQHPPLRIFAKYYGTLEELEADPSKIHFVPDHYRTERFSFSKKTVLASPKREATMVLVREADLINYKKNIRYKIFNELARRAQQESLVHVSEQIEDRFDELLTTVEEVNDLLLELPTYTAMRVELEAEEDQQ